MARKIDPAVDAILKGLKINPTDALWDCHGTWVMYHRFIEKVAAEQGIAFDPPIVLEANGQGKSVAICVTGKFRDRSEWSIGEASEHNYRTKGNQAAYPYAMAEKRAKDRVVLKLIGLHGLVYSDEEIGEKQPDQSEAHPPSPSVQPDSNASLDSQALASDLIAELRKIDTPRGLSNWGASIKDKINGLSSADQERVRGDYTSRLKTLKEAELLHA